MKIDKVIFSSSEEYSDFWNINSEIFKTKLGIEPVCILFGKKSNTNMNEKYGKIIERNFLKDLPLVLQIVWSKFDFTKTEPETTWMIGDIDQIPLCDKWFTKNIQDLDDTMYVHLNAGASCEAVGLSNDAWMTDHPVFLYAKLPAHYHIAKGKIFTDFYELNNDFEEQIKKIVIEEIGSIDKLKEIQNPTQQFWCAEERFSTRILREKFILNKFKPFYYSNNTNKICRSRYDHNKNDYIYYKKQLESKNYVDIHCDRPYNKTRIQIENIINIAWKKDSY
jgi:hypothetical protein